jgi:poly-gamma-glutamate synthesis protein (capsule biosynthesis protein)
MRTAAKMFGGILAAFLLLALAWWSFWTHYDPPVDVPAPVRIDAPSREGSATGRVLLLGDTAPTDAAMPRIREHGWGYPYDEVRDLVRSFDAAVANLEAPVTTSDRPWPVHKRWVYKIHPDALPELRRAGIDAVTLANNHTTDYGGWGLGDTLSHLDEAGIAHLGAHLSEAGARRGLVVDTAGGRLGLLSVMENQSHWRLWSMAFALDTPFRPWAGVARLRYSDLAEDIARLRKTSDLVVAIPHWGKNYKPVTRRQEILGRAMIDLGADAVVGHHAHEFQPVEIHRGRPIIYGLGNFAFGTIGKNTMRHGMGAALHLEGGRLRRIELIPLLTQNRIVDYQVRVPSGADLDAFFAKLVPSSAARGAVVERHGDRGVISLGDGI